MSLEIRLSNRALRASNSSPESQEFKGSGISEGELVEVAAWLRDESIGVSSLAGVGMVATGGAAKVSAGPGIEETGVEGVAAAGDFPFSCSTTFSSSFSFSAFSSFSFPTFSSSFPSPYKQKSIRIE